MQVQFEGTDYEFPDDATDTEIKSFLGGKKPPAPKAEEAPRMSSGPEGAPYPAAERLPISSQLFTPEEESKLNEKAALARRMLFRTPKPARPVSERGPETIKATPPEDIAKEKIEKAIEQYLPGGAMVTGQEKVSPGAVGKAVTDAAMLGALPERHVVGAIGRVLKRIGEVPDAPMAKVIEDLFKAKEEESRTMPFAKPEIRTVDIPEPKPKVRDVGLPAETPNVRFGKDRPTSAPSPTQGEMPAMSRETGAPDVKKTYQGPKMTGVEEVDRLITALSKEPFERDADDLLAIRGARGRIKPPSGLTPHVSKGEVPSTEPGPITPEAEAAGIEAQKPTVEKVSPATLTGVHYGPEGLTELKGPSTVKEVSQYSGEKVKQIEAGEDFPDHPYIPTVDLYKSETKPEVTVTTGKKKYDVDLTGKKFYDLEKDPEGFISQSSKEAKDLEQSGNQGLKKNLLHEKIRAAGFDGYETKDQYRMLDKVPVSEKTLPEKILEAGLGKKLPEGATYNPAPLKMRTLLKDKGGFTISREGNSIDEGFMVGTPGHGEVFDHIPKPSEISAWQKKVAPLIEKNPILHYGGWEEDGKYYLDLAEKFDTAKEAEAATIARGEKAYRDLKAGKDIYPAQNKKSALEKILSEEGSVAGILAQHIAGAGVGAATGGAVDEDNRLRGALIGGAAGAAAPGLIRRMARREESAEPKIVEEIRQKYGMPKLITPRTEQFAGKVDSLAKDLEKVDPALKDTVDTTLPQATRGIGQAERKEAANLAKEEMIRQDKGAAPGQQISKQTRDEILGNPTKYAEYARSKGITTEALAHQLADEASSAGRELQFWSDIKKDMSKMHPDLQAALADKIPPVTTWDKIVNLPRKVIETWRGLLTTQMATAVRNMISQGARAGIDVVEVPLRKMLGDTTTDRGWQELTNFFKYWGNEGISKKMDTLLKDFPKIDKDYFGTISGDVSVRGKRKESGVSRWVVDKLNFMNTAQEIYFRKGIYYSKLESQLASKGMDLSEIIKTGDWEKLRQPGVDMDGPGKTALEVTFAKPPEAGAMKNMVDAINLIPGGLGKLVITFPRFMANQLKFLVDYSPLGISKLLNPEARKAWAAGDRSVAAKALIGSGLLGTSFAVRAGSIPGITPGEKWYEIKDSKGHLYDMRFYNPITTYLWAAEALKQTAQGGFPKFETITDGFEALTGMRGVGILWGVEKMLGAAKNLYDSDATPLQKEEAWKNLIESPAGTFASGFATPITTLRDFYAGFGEHVTKNLSVQPLTAPTQAKIPGAEEALSPAYSPTRREPRKVIAPATRQLTGLSEAPARNFIENEIERFNFKPEDIVKKVGDPEFDNLWMKNMGNHMEEISGVLEKADFYSKASDAIKQAILMDVFSTVRKDAKDEALGELYKINPKKAEQIVQKGSVSDRKRKIMNSVSLEDFFPKESSPEKSEEEEK